MTKRDEHILFLIFRSGGNPIDPSPVPERRPRATEGTRWYDFSRGRQPLRRGSRMTRVIECSKRADGAKEWTMPNYNKLTKYLIGCDGAEVTLTYEEIADILGEKLPETAYSHPNRFWYNSDRSSYYKVWKKAGYLAEPDIHRNSVRFVPSGAPVYGPVDPDEGEKPGYAIRQEEHKIRKANLPKPSVEEVQIYLDKWDGLDNYVMQENSLDKLFFETYPHNKDIRDILVKASCLNDFYSTNIFSIFPVAEHILSLDIDARLEANDDTLVNDIATITVNGKEKYFYSFASKYCSHHKPLDYPIFDDYVKKTLLYFRRNYRFADFEDDDLRDYPKFKKILIEFKRFFDIDQFNLKDIDRYLWQLGKEHFPKNYAGHRR